MVVGLVSKQKSEMASTRENGSSKTRLERISRRLLPVQSGGIQSSSPYGSVAFTSAPVCSTRFPQSPTNWLSQLPNTTGSNRSEQTAAYSTFASSEHQPRPQDHLYSSTKAKSEGTRGEHHQGNANGVMLEMTIGPCKYITN